MEIQTQPVMLLHCGVEIIRQYLSGGDQHNQFNQCQFCCHCCQLCSVLRGCLHAYLPASMYPCKNTEGQGCALPALGFPRRHAKGQEAPGMETYHQT